MHLKEKMRKFSTVISVQDVPHKTKPNLPVSYSVNKLSRMLLFTGNKLPNGRR